MFKKAKEYQLSKDVIAEVNRIDNTITSLQQRRQGVLDGAIKAMGIKLTDGNYELTPEGVLRPVKPAAPQEGDKIYELKDLQEVAKDDIQEETQDAPQEEPAERPS